MATDSTLDQNDPEADNREEFSVPPITVEGPANLLVKIDEDGFEIDPEVTESDDSVASR
jgi:hypothetical protein